MNASSVLFSDTVGNAIAAKFPDNGVIYVSLIPLVDDFQSNWPYTQNQYVGCVEDIADHYFHLLHFIETGGELAEKYASNCSLEAMDRGEFILGLS